MYQILNVVPTVLPKPSALQQPDDTQRPLVENHSLHMQSIEAASSTITPRITGSTELAEIFSQFGMDLWDRCLIKLGETIMKVAEKVLDCIEYEASPVRANIRICLGM